MVKLEGLLGLQEDETPRIPRQLTNEGSKVSSRTYRPPLPPRKYPRYSFVLEAESTPGPRCDRKINPMKNPNDTNRIRTRAVLQPTAPPLTPF